MRWFKKRYLYNDETLHYIEDTTFFKNTQVIFIISTLSIFTIGLICGIKIGISSQTNKEDIVSISTTVGSDPWKDSVFNQYEKRAQLYLDRPEFKGTPINGGMLALAARNSYEKTGILLPVELALAQCQWESSMGRKGKSPKNNPFNIGEYDSGTVIWFDDTFSGIQAYYNLMCTNYLNCKSVHELFIDFVNCKGNRYASGDYENNIPRQYYYITRWINNRIDKK